MLQKQLNQIKNKVFSKYLFFDQSLGVAGEFTDVALLTAAGGKMLQCDFSALSFSDPDFHLHCKGENAVQSFLENLFRYSEQQPESAGFLIVDANLDWFISQEHPAALGVLGCALPATSTVSHEIVYDNFISCQQLKDFPEGMVQGFERSFGVGSYRFMLNRYCP